MSDDLRVPQTASGTPLAPRSWRARLAYLGPGLVLAAAGIGAADMVTALSGASAYGMGLLWAALIGVVVKFAITEAVGRLHLATGLTPMSGLRTASRWLPWVFLVFLLVIGLVYGAALGSVAALAVSALFPALPVTAMSIVLTLVAGAMVVVGRYRLFERVMTGFTIVMFAGAVATAAVVIGHMDDPGRLVSTLRPALPEGSIMTVLALIGGIGGSAGIAAYGYWVKEKGWRDSSWLPIMRADSGLSFAVVFLFVCAMTVLGTGMLYGTGESIAGSSGLAALADPMGDLLGSVTRILFLITFFFVVFSSIVGGFNALSYLMADCVRVIRAIPEEDADRHMATTSRPFRAFVGYCVLTSVVVVFTGRPVTLVMLYAIFGALILPVLSGALLWLLNRRSVEPVYRNGILSNIGLAGAFVLFGILGVAQILESF
ncbi:Nramp family divalent metal transporter [Amycolatopsis sp. YIM 10]|uniref:Nramp family divalent metal transporter n=1 Tax=Amycolatopsis sp. YIM 10 TaxID=2653857 RepID=UPI00129001FE|nr:Nramp family divalent metal transporter [Amycolatopsis sp. YIM 10]QFU93564.1 Natural resistance-associated macrophage protein [Amycolatopsis sp. YIM 10]